MKKRLFLRIMILLAIISIIVFLFLIRKPHFIIIGNPHHAESILNDNKIAYRKYTWQQTEIPIKYALAVITDNPYGTDIPPQIIKAAQNNIPIISSWHKDDYGKNPLYQLNDTITFYKEQNNLSDAVKKIIKQNPEIKEKARKARRFIEKITTNQAYTKETNTLTISLSTGVGSYGAGDYWLAKDMEQAFTDKGYLTSITFENSQYNQPSDVYINLRGSLLWQDFEKSGNINILYQIYPDQGYKDKNKYYQDLTNVLKNQDVFISASEKIADKMRKLGYKSYYLPQSTETANFYPRYNPNLASEVLFVGNYHFKREGLLWGVEQGLPLTIYGDNYPEGWAKQNYIDNRRLNEYYSSAKIVLNDTMPIMKEDGFISNRIFDATACGVLVISDYMPEIEKIYGNSIPMYKTPQELSQLVFYYLTHDDERIALAKRARQITLNNFTTEKTFKKLMEIITELHQN